MQIANRSFRPQVVIIPESLVPYFNQKVTFCQTRAKMQKVALLIFVVGLLLMAGTIFGVVRFHAHLPLRMWKLYIATVVVIALGIFFMDRGICLYRRKYWSDPKVMKEKWAEFFHSYCYRGRQEAISLLKSFSPRYCNLFMRGILLEVVLPLFRQMQDTYRTLGRHKSLPQGLKRELSPWFSIWKKRLVASLSKNSTTAIERFIHGWPEEEKLAIKKELHSLRDPIARMAHTLYQTGGMKAVDELLFDWSKEARAELIYKYEFDLIEENPLDFCEKFLKDKEFVKSIPLERQFPVFVAALMQVPFGYFLDNYFDETQKLMERLHEIVTINQLIQLRNGHMDSRNRVIEEQEKNRGYLKEYQEAITTFIRGYGEKEPSRLSELMTKKIQEVNCAQHAKLKKEHQRDKKSINSLFKHYFRAKKSAEEEIEKLRAQMTIPLAETLPVYQRAFESNYNSEKSKITAKKERAKEKFLLEDRDLDRSFKDRLRTALPSYCNREKRQVPSVDKNQRKLFLKAQEKADRDFRAAASVEKA